MRDSKRRTDRGVTGTAGMGGGQGRGDGVDTGGGLGSYDLGETGWVWGDRAGLVQVAPPRELTNKVITLPSATFRMPLVKITDS